MLWISVETTPTSSGRVRVMSDDDFIWSNLMTVDFLSFYKSCQILKSWKSGPGSAVIFSYVLIDFSHRDSIGVSYGTSVCGLRRSRGGSMTISHCVGMSLKVFEI